MPARKRRKSRTNRTPEKRKRSAPDWAPRLLAELRERGNIRAACEAAGVGRQTVYDRRDADQAFARQFADALEDGCDRLELEAHRRAHDGLLRKKFSKTGEPIIDPDTKQQYAEREYSDTLLIFLLKAHRPQKYRENFKHEHTGKDDGPIEFSHLTDAELDERIAQLEIQVRGAARREAATPAAHS